MPPCLSAGRRTPRARQPSQISNATGPAIGTAKVVVTMMVYQVPMLSKTFVRSNCRTRMSRGTKTAAKTHASITVKRRNARCTAALTLALIGRPQLALCPGEHAIRCDHEVPTTIHGPVQQLVGVIHSWYFVMSKAL